MVPSIMSPDTTTNSMPAASSCGRRSRRASSPARLLRATGSYSGMVSDGLDEVRLVARDEHDAAARREQRQRRLEHVDLRVAVQPQRVVLAHAALHAAGGIRAPGCRGRPRRRARPRTCRPPNPGRSGRRRPRSPCRRPPRCSATTLSARASLLRKLMTTFAPAAARYPAVSAPMPRDEPVMSARLPSSEPAGRTGVVRCGGVHGSRDYPF